MPKSAGAASDISAYEYLKIRGDVNHDEKVTIQDVQACVNHISGKQDWGNAADVTGDGKVDKSDIDEIIDIIKNFPIPAQYVNIASYANIKTNLYGPFNKRMVDGVLGTGLIQKYYRYQFENIDFNQSVEFRFNNPQKIVMIRYTLPPKYYIILADTTGDGIYDAKLKEVTDGAGGGFWGKTEWPYESWLGNVHAYAIKFMGRESLHLMEFQIFCDEEDVDPGLIIPSPELESGFPNISENDLVAIPAPDNSNRYLNGIYIETWMYDLPGWIASNPRGNLSDWPAFRRMVNDLKDIHANMVWIMPCRTWQGSDGYSSPVMWPSNYIDISSPENYLAMTVDALHADGIKVFVGERPYPGWKPKEEVNPSDVFAGGVSEIAESGADGVAICYDEACNFPSAWSSCIKQAVDASKAAKAVNPDIQTITNVQIYNKRSWGFPDLGNMADVDLLGTEGYFTFDDPFGHWHPAISTKRMIGANPKRNSIITQNAPWAPGSFSKYPWVGTGNNPLFYETFPPVSMYGAILSSTMHGGKAMAFWRLYTMLFYNNYHEYTAMGYDMLDTLSSWGGINATVSDEILVLHSYSSTSIYAKPSGWAYYAIVYFYRYVPKGEDYPLEEIRGYVSEEAILELLLKNGYPFQYQISDFGNDVSNLTDYKVIIIPFPYYIDPTTLAKLEEAVNNGTRLIILGKPGNGSTIRSTVSSAFNNLITNSNVTVLTDDILHGITPEFEESFLGSLDNALLEDKPTYLNRYGQDIELSSLEKTDTEKFLFVTNWENHSVTVDVGINMPEGNYHMLQRDLNETRNISISGKYSLTKQDLAKFRINMDAGEALIFYIYPTDIVY